MDDMMKNMNGSADRSKNDKDDDNVVDADYEEK